MKEFTTEQEHLEFLKPIASRYRRFLCAYLKITKTQMTRLTSKQLNIPEEECRISKINTVEQLTTFINYYKDINQALIGKRNLPFPSNVRKLAKQIRGEENNGN